MNRPTDVAVDPDGDIYVADWNNNRLQVFDPEGNYLTHTTGEGTLSKWGANKLDGGNPGDVARAQPSLRALNGRRTSGVPVGVEPATSRDASTS